MFQQIFTIARNTFLESIRQPVVSVLLIAALLALIGNNAMAAYTMEDDNKLMMDMGFSTIFVAGLLMAAFTATGVLSQEIENKTVLTVVSKPVSRPVFVLGKYLGVAAALGVAFWVMSLVFLLIIRQGVAQDASVTTDWPVVIFGSLALVLGAGTAVAANYLYHSVFTSRFIGLSAIFLTVAWLFILLVNRHWMPQSPAVDLKPQILAGLFLVFLGLQIIIAAAIAASTRLGQVMTLVICLGIFLVGLTSDFLLGRLSDTHAWANLLYRLVPNIQMFWPSDAITQQFTISASYVGLAVVYAAALVSAILCLAIALFQVRDVG